MALSINEELRRTFERATLAREAQLASRPGHWRELAELKMRCAVARERERDLYVARYEARVEVRRRQLIDSAGAKTRAFTPSFAGGDRFSPADLLRQAQRDVRSAHAGRLQRIDDYEASRQTALLDRFAVENRRRDAVLDAFDRAADPGGELRRRNYPRDG